MAANGPADIVTRAEQVQHVTRSPVERTLPAEPAL